MKISMAHLKEHSTNGGWINFAVFDAKSTTGDNAGLSNKLTMEARSNGLKVDQSALAFQSGVPIQLGSPQDVVAKFGAIFSLAMMNKIPKCPDMILHIFRK